MVVAAVAVGAAVFGVVVAVVAELVIHRMNKHQQRNYEQPRKAIMNTSGHKSFLVSGWLAKPFQ